MKVRELVEKLSELHPDMEVAVSQLSGSYYVTASAIDLRRLFAGMFEDGEHYWRPAFGEEGETVAVIR